MENWKKNRESLFIAFAFTLFIFIACYKLTNASLWGDETTEYWFSKIISGKLPFDDAFGIKGSGTMYQRIIFTFQPPLYNVIMHFWLKISNTEWWLRFFGVIMGLIGMAGIYKSIKKLSNALVAALAVIFSSTIFQLVYYWQEAAEYCLMLGTLCWTIYFWICLIQEVNQKNIILFTISAIIPIYSQYGAAFSVITMLIIAFILVLLQKSKINIITICISYACAAIFAALPLWFFFLRKQMKNQIGGGNKGRQY